jgi:hypothetical protein
MYSARGERFKVPNYYIDCRLENYGKVPAVDVHYHAHFRVGSPTAAQSDLLIEADAIAPDGGSFEYAVMKGTQSPIYVTYTNHAEFADVGTPELTHHYVSVQHRLDSVEVEFMPPGPRWRASK